MIDRAFRMMNVIQAIESEKRAASICLERLQTFADANKEYLSKVGSYFSAGHDVEFSFMFSSENVNPVNPVF